MGLQAGGDLAQEPLGHFLRDLARSLSGAGGSARGTGGRASSPGRRAGQNGTVLLSDGNMRSLGDLAVCADELRQVTAGAVLEDEVAVAFVFWALSRTNAASDPRAGG